MLRVVLQVRRCQRWGRQRHQQHGRIRRVYLAVRRCFGQFRRQGSLRTQQCGLHINRSRIDITALFELKR